MVHESHKLMDAIFNPLLKGEHLQSYTIMPKVFTHLHKSMNSGVLIKSVATGV